MRRTLFAFLAITAASAAASAGGFSGPGRAAALESLDALAGPESPAALPEPDRPVRDIRAEYDRILGEQSPQDLAAFDAERIQVLFNAVSSNKVAALDRLSHYDPTGAIGFCFGRAMAAHLIASRMGLKRSSAGKAFIIGDLKSGQTTEWRFHVTALVRGADSEWYAIDPVMKKPMTLRSWIGEVRSIWDRTVKARVYLTPPDAVLPDLRAVPPAGREKSRHIIELSFRPDGRRGFAASSEYGPLVFKVGPRAAERFFTGVHEDSRSGRFDFSGITINGKRYDYKGYFPDLVNAVGGGGAPETGAVLMRASMPEAGVSAGAGLMSPRWW